MKQIIFCYLILAFLFSYHGAADSVDIDLNNETVKVQYNLSEASADIGISVSAMLTDDRGEVFALTARTQGQLKIRQEIRGGFGGRVYHASPEQGDSFQSLAIGGYFDLLLPELKDLSLGVEFYYGPSITTSDGIDSFRELNFRATYQLFENAAIYGGLRYVEVEENGFDFEFDDGPHIGFSLQF